MGRKASSLGRNWFDAADNRALAPKILLEGEFAGRFVRKSSGEIVIVFRRHLPKTLGTEALSYAPLGVLWLEHCQPC